MNVAVVGASKKSGRYSYKAVMLLRQKGHKVFPVHPTIEEIEGIGVCRSIRDIKEEIDTVTMYVGKTASDLVATDILGSNPKRIIFNPGAENPDLERMARGEGILTLNACTLVLLTTGKF
jgi:predicted CoA-binding protein